MTTTIAPSVSFFVEGHVLHTLQELAWHQWRRLGVKHLDIKRGQGRHPVVFVHINKENVVIKELGLEGAKRELEKKIRELLGSGSRILLGVVE